MPSFWASVCTVHQTYGRNYQRKVEITSGLGRICSLKESHCVCTVQGLEAPCLMQAVLGSGLPWSASFCLAAVTTPLLPVQCSLRTQQQLGDLQGAMDSSSPCLVCGQLPGSSSFLGVGWVRASHPSRYPFHGAGEDCASPQHAGAGSTQCKGWLLGLGDSPGAERPLRPYVAEGLSQADLTNCQKWSLV